MSWLSSLLNAVESYFAPSKSSSSSSSPAVMSSTPATTGSAAKSVPGTTSPAGISNAPLKTTTTSTKKSSSSSSLPSSGGSNGGGNSGSGSNPGPSNPASNILDGISTVEKVAAPVIGKAGKALTGVGNAVTPAIQGINKATGLNIPTQFVPGGLGAQGQNFGGYQDAISRAKQQGWLPDIPDYMSGVSKIGPAVGSGASSIENQIWNYLQGLRGGGSIIANPNLNKVLPPTSNQPSGKAGKLNTQTQGQAGVTPSMARNIIPSPITGANKNGVPSAVSGANLPANFAGLTQGNTNPALTSQVTPQAMQSLGQMLIKSILGNQSSMNSMSPQLAQALWGAPTASSAFGGYDSGAAVPSQASVTPSKNIPLPLQPLATG